MHIGVCDSVSKGQLLFPNNFSPLNHFSLFDRAAGCIPTTQIRTRLAVVASVVIV